MNSPERILILVKPDGVRRGLVGQVISRVEARGFVIETLTMREPSRDLLTLHYAEHAEKAFFPALLDFMASGPLVAMVASGQDIIQAFRNMAGATNPTEAAPGSIRGDYGRDWGLGVIQNVVHGSDSPESANREIGLWFPGLSTN